MNDEHSPTRPGSTPEPIPSTYRDSVEAEARKIGNYHILQKLGEGGMGEVWLAEQMKPIRRRVALKIIKRGMDTKEVVARFEVERQALALMDHPAIAKVFDAGATERGRPYFIMEYVKGVPIHDYCDKNQLSTRQRMELFIRACEGVQHAHQKAVIHRDLKPSNILVTNVDGRAQPKIIDFGVAKATASRLTERTMFTEFGQLIGTPEYMSPEQAELSAEDIDTRSDVYSMGVILYQLLVGVLPFEPEELRKAGFDAIRRTIREVDPPTPSTRLTALGARRDGIAASRRTQPAQLRRMLRGDLDWIVMKALEKDRNRRYETANGLAADIRRHLADEPVVARPPDKMYRVRKLVQRNKLAFSAMAAIFVMLVAAVTATSWGMLRAMRAERRAEQEAGIAQAVNEFLNDDLLAVVAPSAERGRGKDVLMREVLDVAAEKIAQDGETKARFAEMPPVEAAIQRTLGNTYKRLGEYQAAEPHLLRALEVRRLYPGTDRLDLAAALADLGDLQECQGLYEQGESHWKQAIEIQTAARGELDLTTIAWMTSLARIFSKQGRSTEAEPLLRRVLELQRSLLGEQHTQTLSTMGSLASFYQELGRNEEAEALQIEALEIRKRHLGEDDPRTMSSMNNLANVYASQGRMDEAIPLYTRALELKRKVLGDEHPSTLNTWNNLAEVQEVLGDYERAETLHRDVLAGRTHSLGAEHPRTLRSGGRLAYVLMKLARLDEAEDRARRVISSYQATQGADHPYTLEVEDILGMILLRQGRVTEAEQVLRRVHETLAEKHADDLYTRTLVGAHLGLVLAELDRAEEAEALWIEVAGDLPVGDAETSSILGEVVAHFERWHQAAPNRGYERKASDWRARLVAAEGS